MARYRIVFGDRGDPDLGWGDTLQVLVPIAHAYGHRQSGPGRDSDVDFLIGTGNPIWTDEALRRGDRFFAVQQAQSNGRVRYFVRSTDAEGARQPIELPMDKKALEATFDRWLRSTFPAERIGAPQVLAELSIQIEVFVALWQQISPELGLNPEDARIGDAFAQMASQVGNSEVPPKKELRPIFEWFKNRLDSYADSLADAAGKATAVGIGVGAAQGFPMLMNVVNRVLNLL